jgi:hypothetical protein
MKELLIPNIWKNYSKRNIGFGYFKHQKKTIGLHHDRKNSF